MMSWSSGRLNKAAPKLGAIDLNLLVVFVRSPTGMMPTPRSEELATPIRIALEGLQQSLEPVQFEPSEATRTFHIAVDNYAAIVLVAPIAARIAKIAPGVTLDFRPSGTLDVLQLLDRSELDSALGRFGAQGERFSLKRLLQDQFVVVHRKGHPAAQAREFSTEKLATLPQLEISSAQFGPDFVDPGCADSGDIGPGVGTSAQRRQKYDQVSPARFPSAVAFTQTDRSCHDLAATA